MNTDLPMPITTDTDLDYYEQYLKREFSTITQPTENCLAHHIKNYIGKQIKAELIPYDRVDIRLGVLLRTGDDFLVIKMPNLQEAVIPLKSVKAITVLQNNTKPPYF